MDRRLSAILVADIVGYSRLMEADEVRTIDHQKSHHTDLIEPALARHAGRIFKLTGDGLLAEFPSVIEAVSCAVEVQRAMAEREAEMPEDLRIVYRVGINLGDVIHEEGDLHGDGVNIAARLEQIAEPGGICISGTAYDHLRSAVDVGYEDLGEIQVKNIARPIRAWRVLLEADKIGQVIATASKPRASYVNTLAIALVMMALASGGAWWWLTRPDFTPVDPDEMTLSLPAEPSIAILPFSNLSGDASNDWIGDGITDSIISTLSISPEMVVMGRGTSFSYKGKLIDPRTVAKDLGVRYVLTGSVQNSGDRMRVTAELSDAVAGKVLWSVIEDGTEDDLFRFQDQIAQKLFVELQVALTIGESSRSIFALAGDFETIVRLLEGRVEFQKFSNDGHLAALAIWSEISRNDPTNPLGPYLMGYISWQKGVIGISRDPAGDFAKARTLAHDSLALHEFGDPYALLAMIDTFSGNYESAIEMANRAIELSPGSADTNAIGGNAKYVSGDAKEGLDNMLKGMRLEPDFPEWLASAIYPALLEQGRYHEAITLARSVLAAETVDGRAKPTARIMLIVGLLLKGEVSLAQEEARGVMRAAPDLTSRSLTTKFFSSHKPRPFHATFRDALIASGIPEGN